MGPWHLETLVIAPTLFMDIAAFIWVQLIISLGRRPAFLIASLVIMLATFGAGYARTFQHLLGCICIRGLGEGFALSAVCTLRHTCLMGIG
jgi:MFS family permease